MSEHICLYCGIPLVRHLREKPSRFKRRMYCGLSCANKATPPIPRRAIPVERRFMAKVQVEPGSGCWLWTAVLDKDGYGFFCVRPGQLRRAHRVAYELFIGPIPEGLQLDHVCHTTDPDCRGGKSCSHRRCVNPAHLEPVTGPENTRRGYLASRTHCVRGHPFDEENTHVRADGARECRTCRRDLQRARSKARKRLGVPA